MINNKSDFLKKIMATAAVVGTLTGGAMEVGAAVNVGNVDILSNIAGFTNNTQILNFDVNNGVAPAGPVVVTVNNYHGAGAVVPPLLIAGVTSNIAEGGTLDLGVNTSIGNINGGAGGINIITQDKILTLTGNDYTRLAAANIAVGGLVVNGAGAPTVIAATVDGAGAITTTTATTFNGVIGGVTQVDTINVNNNTTFANTVNISGGAAAHGIVNVAAAQTATFKNNVNVLNYILGDDVATTLNFDASGLGGGGGAGATLKVTGNITSSAGGGNGVLNIKTAAFNNVELDGNIGADDANIVNKAIKTITFAGTVGGNAIFKGNVRVTGDIVLADTHASAIFNKNVTAANIKLGNDNNSKVVIDSSLLALGGAFSVNLTVNAPIIATNAGKGNLTVNTAANKNVIFAQAIGAGGVVNVINTIDINGLGKTTFQDSVTTNGAIILALGGARQVQFNKSVSATGGFNLGNTPGSAITFDSATGNVFLEVKGSLDANIGAPNNGTVTTITNVNKNVLFRNDIGQNVLINSININGSGLTIFQGAVKTNNAITINDGSSATFNKSVNTVIDGLILAGNGAGGGAGTINFTTTAAGGAMIIAEAVVTNAGVNSTVNISSSANTINFVKMVTASNVKITNSANQVDFNSGGGAANGITGNADVTGDAGVVNLRGVTGNLILRNNAANVDTGAIGGTLTLNNATIAGIANAPAGGTIVSGVSNITGNAAAINAGASTTINLNSSLILSALDAVQAFTVGASPIKGDGTLVLNNGNTLNGDLGANGLGNSIKTLNIGSKAVPANYTLTANGYGIYATNIVTDGTANAINSILDLTTANSFIAGTIGTAPIIAVGGGAGVPAVLFAGTVQLSDYDMSNAVVNATKTLGIYASKVTVADGATVTSAGRINATTISLGDDSKLNSSLIGTNVAGMHSVGDTFTNINLLNPANKGIVDFVGGGYVSGNIDLGAVAGSEINFDNGAGLLVGGVNTGYIFNNTILKAETIKTIGSTITLYDPQTVTGKLVMQGNSTINTYTDGTQGGSGKINVTETTTFEADGLGHAQFLQVNMQLTGVAAADYTINLIDSTGVIAGLAPPQIYAIAINPFPAVSILNTKTQAESKIVSITPSIDANNVILKVKYNAPAAAAIVAAAGGPAEIAEVPTKEAGDLLLQLESLAGNPEAQEQALELAGLKPDVAQETLGTMAVTQEVMQSVSTNLNARLASIMPGMSSSSAVSPSPLPSSSGSNPESKPNNKDSKISKSKDEGVGGGDNFENLGVWANGFGGNALQKRKSGNSGYKSTIYGGSIGIDSALNEYLVVGTAVTKADADVKYKDLRNGNTTKSDMWMFSLYGLYNFGNNYFVQSIASYGINQITSKEKRNLDVMSGKYTTATGKFKSRSGSIEFSGGYRYALKDDLVLTPLAGLQFATYYDGSYSETGDDKFKNSSAKKYYNQLIGILGTGVNSYYRFEDETLLIPEAHAFVNQVLTSKDAKAKVRSTVLPKTVMISTQKPIKTVWTLGLSGTIKSGMAEFGAGYDATISKKYLGHQGSVKVRINF